MEEFCCRREVAIGLVLPIRLFGALRSIIQDCDEVFNFWEAAHYLSFGSGLQTWEYSPVYSIRSWAYILPHALTGKLSEVVFGLSKKQQFFMIRATLAVLCSLGESALVSSLAKAVNPRLGFYALLICLGSAAFLPSSFSMYTTFFALAAQVQSTRIRRTSVSMFWFALGAILSWPFSLALSMSLFLEEFLFAGSIQAAIQRVLKGVSVSLPPFLSVITVDSLAYRKFSIVPLNIVLYNVFPGDSSRGPELYGTEPWTYYFNNLFLNFNSVFLLALMTAPLLLVTRLSYKSRISDLSRLLIWTIPFYSWFAIYSMQPHKEERFMFPAYPALVLSAAISLYSIESTFRYWVPNTRFQNIAVTGPTLSLLCLYGIISASRVAAVISNYDATFAIFNTLNSTEHGTACFGKDWYRYPSSYFLPDNMRVGFVKSAFDGILPGQFPEEQTSFPSTDFRKGTWVIPDHMNDENREEPAHYTPMESCDYFVSSSYRGDTEDEERSHLNTRRWSEEACLNLIDPAKTPILGRSFRVPFVERRRFGKYCLYKRVSE